MFCTSLVFSVFIYCRYKSIVTKLIAIRLLFAHCLQILRMLTFLAQNLFLTWVPYGADRVMLRMMVGKGVWHTGL
jgi:hypothetical protein